MSGNRVKCICSRSRSPKRPPVFPMYALLQVRHLIAYTTFKFDCNVSSGSNNRGRYVGNIAEGKKEK